MDDGKYQYPISMKDPSAQLERVSSKEELNEVKLEASHNQCNVNRLKVVGSPNTHVGPKFVASNLTVQVINDENVNKKLTRFWMITSSVTAAIILSVCISILINMSDSAEEDILDDSDVPSDWYYDRELMNMPSCDNHNINMTANLIIVDSMEVNCDDVDSCTQVIKSLPKGPHFYLKDGHIFEGLGWNCEPIKDMKVVFLSEEINSAEMYSFNMLLDLGTMIKMVSYRCEILPICCFEDNVPGPSKSVTTFLKTLIDFKDRECLTENDYCY